jgi:AraC-like DNA-binding protein
MEHRIYSTESDWKYCWCTIDGSFAEAHAVSFGLKSGVADCPGISEKLFTDLMDIISDVSINAEYKAGVMVYELLATIAQADISYGKNIAAYEAMEIINRQWDSPLLGVEGISQDLGVHRSSLCREFTASYGLSPHSYIKALRLQKAMSMLESTDMDVAEISRKCGYDDPSYFSRLIKKEIGVSPSEFRRHGDVNSKSSNYI